MAILLLSCYIGVTVKKSKIKNKQYREDNKIKIKTGGVCLANDYNGV